MTLIILILLLCSFTNCSTVIEYESDKGFQSAEAAKANELPVSVNRNTCKGISGQVGVCSISISADQKLKFEIIPRPYSYELSVTCSNNIDFERSFSVPEEKVFSFEILPEHFSGARQFICVGRVIPDGRDFLSGSFDIRVRVHDAEYTKRSTPFVLEEDDKKYINFGRHALHVWLHNGDTWEYYKKSPAVEIEGNPKKYKGFSESEAMRYNTFNL